MEAKTNPQITECTKSLNALSGAKMSMSPTANYLLNVSFSDSADHLYWPKMQTFHLSYVKAFNLDNGLSNFIGSLFSSEGTDTQKR